MRDLLPLPESARLRLSQLQIMSLSCVFIRKCQLLEKRKYKCIQKFLRTIILEHGWRFRFNMWHDTLNGFLLSEHMECQTLCLSHLGFTCVSMYPSICRKQKKGLQVFIHWLLNMLHGYKVIIFYSVYLSRRVTDNSSMPAGKLMQLLFSFFLPRMYI